MQVYAIFVNLQQMEPCCFISFKAEMIFLNVLFYLLLHR